MDAVDLTGRPVVVLEQTIAYDGHFKIIRYRLRHRLFAGGMSRELKREVFERAMRSPCCRSIRRVIR